MSTAAYTIAQTGEESFDVLRDGRRVVGTGGGVGFAEEMLAEYRDQELQAGEALATGDPLAICAIGWHRGGAFPDRMTGVSSSGLYVRYITTTGESGGTLVYRVAEGPFLWASRTVKTLGNVQPWTCPVCDRAVGPA